MVAMASIVATVPGGSVPVMAHAHKQSGTVYRPLKAYRGLGTWVDIYNPGMWRHPERKVRAMHRHGVRTIYIETGNYKIRRRLFKPDVLARYLAAAHSLNMRVVAWFVPSLADVRRDLRRSLAAIRFRAAHQRFDGFSMDIESTVVRSITRRNHQLRRLSRKLRRHIARRRTLGAIVPNPADQTFWPRFPYRRIANRYDVFLPMGYWTNHHSGYRSVYRMISGDVNIIRFESGHPREPVHVIGGIANAATRREVRAMIDSGRAHGILGGGLYDFPLTRAEQWRQLRRLNR